MHTVRDIALEIVGREGGYVNDPSDPGGPTKYGVTIGTLRMLGVDLDSDGDVDIQDVKLLTVEKAVEIFETHYFHKPRIAELPEELQATVFDMQVNSGANAVKILQRLCNMLGEALKVDGQIGPKTIAAVVRVRNLAPNHIADAYGIERREYYYRLADSRVASRKYARRKDGGKGGWITRAEEFISPRFHFTDQQHNERVSKWA